MALSPFTAKSPKARYWLELPDQGTFLEIRFETEEDRVDFERAHPEFKKV